MEMRRLLKKRRRFAAGERRKSEDVVKRRRGTNNRLLMLLLLVLIMASMRWRLTMDAQSETKEKQPKLLQSALLKPLSLSQQRSPNRITLISTLTLSSRNHREVLIKKLTLMLFYLAMKTASREQALQLRKKSISSSSIR